MLSTQTTTFQQGPLDQRQVLRTCSGCGERASQLRKCGGCKQVEFCSLECQKRHWKRATRGSAPKWRQAQAALLKKAFFKIIVLFMKSLNDTAEGNVGQVHSGGGKARVEAGWQLQVVCSWQGTRWQAQGRPTLCLRVDGCNACLTYWGSQAS